jgi:putative ABC transport system ATP-binding protein
MLIELENTTKIYNQGKPNEVTALHNVSLQIEDQTMVCLQGASGSGKSTLLAIIGCVFPPSSGRASIAGKQLSRMPDRFLTSHRRESIGFFFNSSISCPVSLFLTTSPFPLCPLEFHRAQEKQERVSSWTGYPSATGRISRPDRYPVAKCSALQSPGP